MVQGTVTDQDVAELIERVTTATKAYIRGDMRTYFSLIRHGEDHVLLSPFGGEPVRDTEVTPERIEALEQFFRGGSAELEVIETYVSGDMVVLVAFERQHGEVGGLPEQDWSLRVTLVFRRDESGWRQVHRHADALVHEIDLDQLSALAQGRRLPAVS
jgi:ketosteroid isomerase-like protein